MADDKRVVRTAGVYGTFHVGDVTITPEGTEVSFEEWKTVAAAAVENQVVVRLDEDFPGELYAADAAKRLDEESPPPVTGDEENVETPPATSVPEQTSGRRARNGG